MHELKTVTPKELRALPDYSNKSDRTVRRLKESIIEFRGKDHKQPLTVLDVAVYFGVEVEAVYMQIFCQETFKNTKI